ncbi:hypothetical protein EDWATA_01784 [Edwardsiella tarda ATCC 23685]|uniref:Uncharacterized protein n=1 Tax=Edwardsiella tarda ATCC 23685 TaxID=500638 RepID=D4F4V7_EDWTA|nr:hypothetical protein EDWATA_01784 [Edwardsiella tarda ATCC 23685]
MYRKQTSSRVAENFLANECTTAAKKRFALAGLIVQSIPY